jgi:hypothetical protein
MGRFSPTPDPLERRLRDDMDALAPQAESGHGLATGDPAGLHTLREPTGVRPGAWGLGLRIGHAALAILGGAVGFLLHPVRTVDFEGSVVASSVEMVTTGPHIVALNAPVAALGAHGYTHVEYTGVKRVPGSGRGSLTALPAAGGVLELEQITIPMGALLTVKQEPIGALNLRVAPGTGTGQVRFTMPGGGYVLTGSDTLTVEPGALVEMKFDTLRFNLWFAPNARPLDLLSQLSVSGLSFTETIVGADGMQEDRMSLSTIQGGTLTLSAPKTEYPLRAREPLQMRLQEARVHQLRSDTGGIAVTFRARASDLALGDEGMQRTLKPSRLEWLSANPLVALVYAALTAVSSLIILFMLYIRNG